MGDQSLDGSEMVVDHPCVIASRAPKIVEMRTPQYKSFLKRQWLEESQYSKIEELTANASAKEIDQAVKEYGEIGAFLDHGI